MIKGTMPRTSLCYQATALGQYATAERNDKSKFNKIIPGRAGGREEGKRPYQPLCLWYCSQCSERDVFLRWNTAEERKGLYTSKRVVRPLSCCRWLNFARIPRTKIAIRAGATSEFFMPASRGYGKKQLPLAAVYFLCTFYFCFPPPSRLYFYIILPSTTFRFSASFTLIVFFRFSLILSS